MSATHRRRQEGEDGIRHEWRRRTDLIRLHMLMVVVVIVLVMLVILVLMGKHRRVKVERAHGNRRRVGQNHRRVQISGKQRIIVVSQHRRMKEIHGRLIRWQHRRVDAVRRVIRGEHGRVPECAAWSPQKPIRRIVVVGEIHRRPLRMRRRGSLPSAVRLGV